MDEFDNKLKQSFTKDIDVPNQCRNAIKNALYTNKKRKSYFSEFILKKAVTIASVGIIFVGGVVFATNFNNIKEYFGLGKRIGYCYRKRLYSRTKYGLHIFKWYC